MRIFCSSQEMAALMRQIVDQGEVKILMEIKANKEPRIERPVIEKNNKPYFRHKERY